MKIPRWLIVLMISLIILLPTFGAGWFWITWPERTAREFVDLSRAMKTSEARSMLTPKLAAFFARTDEVRDAHKRAMGEGVFDAVSRTGAFDLADSAPPKQYLSIEVLPRTWLDLLKGRAIIKGAGGADTQVVFIERGTVVDFGYFESGEFRSYTALEYWYQSMLEELTRERPSKPNPDE